MLCSWINRHKLVITGFMSFWPWQRGFVGSVTGPWLDGWQHWCVRGWPWPDHGGRSQCWGCTRITPRCVPRYYRLNISFSQVRVFFVNFNRRIYKYRIKRSKKLIFVLHRPQLLYDFNFKNVWGFIQSIVPITLHHFHTIFRQISQSDCDERSIGSKRFGTCASHRFLLEK